jgi:hypothetical protein
VDALPLSLVSVFSRRDISNLTARRSKHGNDPIVVPPQTPTPANTSLDCRVGGAFDFIEDSHRELDRRLREYCAAHTALEVETEVNAAKIGCARVFNTRDQYEDAHYAAREMRMPVLDRQSGVPIRVYGVVPKMSLTPGRIWRGAPSIGDDTTDILAQMLGLSEGAIDKLYADSVVHRTEPFTEPQVAAVNP